MSLREWLIAIGALVILGIVIDGVRRMRRTRREAAAISSGMGADNIADPDAAGDHNPELPNGGSRPIDRDELESRGYVKTQQGRSRFGNPPQKPTRPVVGGSRPHGSNPEIDRSHDDLEDAAADSGFTARDVPVDDVVDESLTAYDDSRGRQAGDSGAGYEQDTDRAPETTPDTRSGRHDQRASAPAAKPEVPAGSADTGETNAARDDGETASTPPTQLDPTRPPAGANRPDAQEVIVINVLANQERLFDGGSLRRLFEGCGLEFGDMDIYHRHEENDTRTPVQFSVANALKPGTFRAEDFEGMKTPGISFFMSMPGPSDAMQAFEFMLETAQCVVKNLDGELKDERRSVMTRQTIEHCRQRIREYERKRRSQPVS